MTPAPPQFHSRATLSDLMDRLLDRGLFLRADLVISVAGIPLIGASLSLALAGMETLLKFGVMDDWDREIRSGQQSAISGQQKQEACLADR